jgi:hypothetical protein
MANYELKINAISIFEMKRQLKEWCEEMDVMPDVSPEDVLCEIDIDTIRGHLEQRLADQGFTLDIKAMIDEVVEVKAPKRAKREKAPELPMVSDEPDPALEAVKSDVIRKLQALYLQPGGKAKVDHITASFGTAKLRDIPAEAFPQIATQLEEMNE